MNVTKKILSIFLAALLLCGAVSVGVSAAASTAKSYASQEGILETALRSFIKNVDWGKITETQTTWLIKTLTTMKTLGINYDSILETVSPYLPMSVKAALHDAGLAEYPIWERDMLMYFVFRYLLFGWVWM